MERSRRRRIWLVIPVLMALAAVRTAAMGAASADDGKTVVQEQESTAGTAKTMTGDTAAGDKAEAAPGTPEADAAAGTEEAELSSNPLFNELYVEHMLFPETED